MNYDRQGHAGADAGRNEQGRVLRFEPRPDGGGGNLEAPLRGLDPRPARRAWVWAGREESAGGVGDGWTPATVGD